MALCPLTVANFRLAGGWRQNALVIGAYIAIVAVTAAAVYRNTPAENRGYVSATFAGILGLLQLVMILMVAPAAIRKAVLRDHQTGMIESHRLTPQSGLRFILGYLTGPPSQAGLLFAVGLVLGVFFSAAAGADLGLTRVYVLGWLGLQMAALALGSMIAALALLAALSSSGKANLVPLLMVGGFFGGVFLVQLVPGLALLFGAMTTSLVSRWLPIMASPLRTVPGTELPTVASWSMLAQIAMALVVLAAACRKVRRPDRPAFSIINGLLLTGVFGATLVIGWIVTGNYDPLGASDVGQEAQWIGSAIAFVVVALIPLMSAAADRSRLDRSAYLTNGTPPRMLRTLDALPLLVVLLAAGVMLAMWPDRFDARIAPTWTRSGGIGRFAGATLLVAPALVAILLSCIVDYLVVQIAAARGWIMFRLLLLVWVVLKGLPLVAEGARAVVAEIVADETAHFRGDIAGLSPLGTLIITGVGGDPWPGVIFQAVVAAVVFGVAHKLRAKLDPIRSVKATARPAKP